MDRPINRVKVMLAEKQKSNKWLAEALGVAPTTVSKWCTNSAQPPMETFMQIAKLLEVDINELLRFEVLPDIEAKIEFCFLAIPVFHCNYSAIV